MCIYGRRVLFAIDGQEQASAEAEQKEEWRGPEMWHSSDNGFEKRACKLSSI